MAGTESLLCPGAPQGEEFQFEEASGQAGRLEGQVSASGWIVQLGPVCLKAGPGCFRASPGPWQHQRDKAGPQRQSVGPREHTTLEYEGL